MALLDKKILLAITGGIAAYKSAELCRLLTKAGAQVRVVMTQGAQAFITPLTLQALSGHPVHTDLLDTQAEAAMGHIELARWADLIVIAPASADIIAKIAHGLAGDLLTTLCLATDKPIALAPAMNRLMWSNAATQHNVQTLIERNVLLFGPGTGEQACGETGLGRMQEPEEIYQQVLSVLSDKPLKGQRWLITAGPTQEKIDPVRYLTNKSSGKMGFAIAQAAARAGAEVVLVAGPVHQETPFGVIRQDVESAQQMLQAVKQHIDNCHIFVSCAAVSDYRSAVISEQKMKKNNDHGLLLELEQNPDILKWAASQSEAFCVGFAAETQNIEEYAKAKMLRKGIKVICANDVSKEGLGFSSESNEVCVYYQHEGVIKKKSIGPALKKEIAKHLVLLLDELNSLIQ